MNKHFATFCALAFVCALPASAQTKIARADGGQLDESRCRKDVKDYLEALKFVRQAAGDQIGSQVASGYLSEDQLTHAVSTQGPCSAAQLLRQKGATR